MVDNSWSRAGFQGPRAAQGLIMAVCLGVTAGLGGSYEAPGVYPRSGLTPDMCPSHCTLDGYEKSQGTSTARPKNE